MCLVTTLICQIALYAILFLVILMLPPLFLLVVLFEGRFGPMVSRDADSEDDDSSDELSMFAWKRFVRAGNNIKVRSWL